VKEQSFSCGHRAFLPAQGGQRPFPLPGDKPHYPRDRVADVKHVRLEIAIDFPARRVAGTMYATLAPLHDGLRQVAFDAVDMTIGAVRLEGVGPCECRYEDGVLRVDLGEGRRAGEDVTVAVEYEARPRRGLYFVGPDEGYPDKPEQVWSQGEQEDSRYWFPCYDFPNERASSELLATVPADWTVIGNGELVAVSEDPSGATRTFHWRQDVPHAAYLLSLVAGRFAEVRDTFDGIPVQYFVQPGREEDARRTLGKTPAMLAFFSEVTGLRYPYAKYAQTCVVDFIFGGMENISATTLTDTVLHDDRAHLDFDADGLVAHELAHQWFGDLVTCRDWSHAWLNEGFATYFEALFREHDRGLDEFRYELFRNTGEYLEEDGRHYRRPLVTNVYHDPMDVFDRHLYEKGSLVLHMIRHVLGDDLWWKSIRHYLATHSGKVVTTADFQRSIEEATGRNLDWFFDQWVYKAGHPEFKVAYEWDDGAKQAKLTVSQVQQTDSLTPVFRMPIRVDFSADGVTAPFTIEVSEKEQSFYFPLPQRPQLARFDPGNHVLKTLEFKRPKEMLLYQVRHDDDIMGRIDAAKALGKLGSPDVVPALKDVVCNDPFWGVQAQAARALGSLRSQAARDALLECLSVPHPKARRGVVGALAEFLHDDTAAAALEHVVREGDPSYYVEAEACRSLGKTKCARAFETLVFALGKESHAEVIRVQALAALADLKDERGLAVALDWTTYGRPSPARAAATAALGELGKDKDEAFERLVELLDDPWLRVRGSAVSSLRALKDAKAIPYLERRAERELDARVVRLAREAVIALREGSDRSDEVKKLRADLDRLLEENRGLRDRLDRLEAKLSPPAPER